MHHCGICAAQHVISVDNDVNAPPGKLVFRYMVERGRYNHYRSVVVLLAKTGAELMDIFAVFVAGMNHYSVCPCSDISKGALQRIFYRLAGNQRFYTGYDHEVTGHLSSLAYADLVAEALNSILRLLGFCPKQGVLL